MRGAQETPVPGLYCFLFPQISLSNLTHTFKISFFFLTWTILKVFIDFITVLLLFLCFGFLAQRHVGS